MKYIAFEYKSMDLFAGFRHDELQGIFAFAGNFRKTFADGTYRIVERYIDLSGVFSDHAEEEIEDLAYKAYQDYLTDLKEDAILQRDQEAYV